MLAVDSWLAKNAYDLLSGTRTLAKICGIELSGKPSHEEIQNQLWPVWGSETGFETAIPGMARTLKLDGTTVPSPQVLEALLATGLLDEFGLRTVRGPLMPSGALIILLFGTTANWTRRRLQLLQKLQEMRVDISGVFLLANSGRQCTLKTEVNNPDVLKYQQEHEGEVPNEGQLLVHLANEMLGTSFESVHVDAPNQDEQVRTLFTRRPALAQGNIGVIANANATYVPLQVRRVARELDLMSGFDENYNQMHFIQDSISLATTPQEAEDTVSHQRPLTVFPGLVRFINEVHKLQSA